MTQFRLPAKISSCFLVAGRATLRNHMLANRQNAGRPKAVYGDAPNPTQL